MGRGTVRMSEQFFLDMLHLSSAGPVTLEAAEVVVQDGCAFLDVTLQGKHVPDGNVEAVFHRQPEKITVRFDPCRR